MSNDVFVIPLGGLGNRLLAVLSGIQLARRRGGECYVSWIADDECYCQFGDLFEKNLTIERSQLDNIPSIDRSFSAYEGRQSGSALVEMPKRGDVVVFSNTVFLDDDQIRHRFRHEGHQLATFASDLDALGVLSNIKFSVDQYAHTVPSLKNSVGIHIRRGYRDDKFNTSWLDTISLEFYRKIATASANAGHAIHVCSDDEKVVSLFKEEFGASSFPVESREKGTDVRAVQDALRDMLAMSRCKYIVSLYGSTFGYLSAILGHSSLICIKGHVSTGMELDAAINFGQYDKSGRALVEKHKIIIS
ncbi:hypothetical protein [Methylorubrum sp. GM97]|uniref:hypothetical protein n=1 Tax=Methylorubrum sp. GM97 TaxID=2938232 RepID=UPI0021881058|nr:hypothetical protein [Methylorubrum sp. GM97]BDL41111.1 hypothetical protein MSPGM_37010 [Methylorubrum sp. GM97]